jgi:hypothetical protein
MKNRRIISASAVAAIALGTTVFAASVASASTGGGCGVTRGNVAACVSASGSHVEPDLYITSVPSNCQFVVFELIDDSRGAVVLKETVSCKAGHSGPWAFAGINGHYYKTWAQMTTTSGALFPSTSPTLQLAY